MNYLYCAAVSAILRIASVIQHQYGGKPENYFKKIDYDQYIFYVFSFELQTLSLTYNTLNFIKKDQLKCGDFMSSLV